MSYDCKINSIYEEDDKYDNDELMKCCDIQIVIYLIIY